MSAAARSKKEDVALELKEIERGLNLIRHGGTGGIEIRAVFGPKNLPTSQYFRDIKSAAKAALALRTGFGKVASIDGTKPKVSGVYAVMNSIDPAHVVGSQNTLQTVAEKGATTTDGAITQRDNILIDIDSKRPKGTMATSEQRSAAGKISKEMFDWLQQHGVSESSMVSIDSGNGVHVLIKCELPNDEETRKLVRDLLYALAERFDGDKAHVDKTVWNASRITKIPGTWNRKGEDGHRLSKVIHESQTPFPCPRETIESLLPALNADIPKSKAARGPAATGWNPKPNEVWFRSFVTSHCNVTGEKPLPDGGLLLNIEHCPWKDSHSTDTGDFGVILKVDGTFAVKCFHDSCQRQTWESFYVELCGWEEPVMLDEEVELPEFPTQVLPKMLRYYVTESSAVAGNDPAFTALPALITIGAAAGDKVRLQPTKHDPTFSERAVLWGAIIADSGQIKTPAMKKAIAPAVTIDHEEEEGNNERRRQYALLMEIYKKRRTGYIKNQAEPRPAPEKKPKYVEEGDTGGPPREPEPASITAMLLQDSTVEGARDQMVTEDRGMMLYNDEILGWVGSFDAYRQSGASKDRSAWLEAFNGGRKKFTRAGKDTIIVPNWSVSIIGATTPGGVGKIAGKITDDGLLQRFLYAYGHERRIREDRPIKKTIVANYEKRVRELRAASGLARAYTLTGDARAAWEEIAERGRVEILNPELPDAMRGFLSRIDVIAARLALIFHVAEHGAKAPSTINDGTMRQVAALLFDYACPHNRRFFAEISKNEAWKVQREVQDVILAQDMEGVATISRLGSASRLFRQQGRGFQGEVMHALEVYNWLQPIGENRKHRTQYQINPLVHLRYAAHKERVKTDRAMRKTILELNVQNRLQEKGNGDVKGVAR